MSLVLAGRGKNARICEAFERCGPAPSAGLFGRDRSPRARAAHSPSGWQIIADELAAGSGLQINAWSVAGAYGESVREHAMKAAKPSSLVALASDAHGATRPPALRQGLAALGSAGIADPERLADYTAAALLERGLPVGRSAVAA